MARSLGCILDRFGVDRIIVLARFEGLTVGGLVMGCGWMAGVIEGGFSNGVSSGKAIDQDIGKRNVD